jgi:hypothetical protein
MYYRRRRAREVGVEDTSEWKSGEDESCANQAKE